MDVLVPLESGVNPVEVSRLPRPVLVLPCVRGHSAETLFEVEDLLLRVELLVRLGSVERLRLEIGSRRREVGPVVDLGSGSTGHKLGRRDLPTLGELEKRAEEISQQATDAV